MTEGGDSVLRVLYAQLEVPFWCSFRVPYGVNMHFTYPVPPLTTLAGLVAAALGYPADFLEPLAGLVFGVGLEREGRLIETYTRIIKRDYRDQSLRTLLCRQKLLQPVFGLYIKGPEPEVAKIGAALRDPFFPLFLGESDDPVEIRQIGVYPLKEEPSSVVDNCLPVDVALPVETECQVANLPVRFTGKKRGQWTGVEYQSYYVAPRLQLDREVPAALVGGRRVYL